MILKYCLVCDVQFFLLRVCDVSCCKNLFWFLKAIHACKSVQALCFISSQHKSASPLLFLVEGYLLQLKAACALEWKHELSGSFS